MRGVLADPGQTLCAAQDATPSQAVRRLIRDHLRPHRMQWALGGLDDGAPSLAPPE